ncbi:MAG: DUF418 domain-containing protein [Phycisphaerales bacterium]|nr:DUF418 domain-containing protein [Phycisphaerales bacterium]
MTSSPQVAARTVDEPAGPVSAQRRIDSLDVLRGFAVLGILIMNIQSFALPMAAYMNPTAGGRFDGADYWVWLVAHLLADLKFMSIFSMLFGAGVVLFTSRIEARGRSAAGLHYRRMAWLLLIGLIHGYMLWYGDILVLYSLCGMALFFARGLSPRVLIPLSLVSLLITAGFMALFGLYYSRLQTELDAHDARTPALVESADSTGGAGEIDVAEADAPGGEVTDEDDGPAEALSGESSEEQIDPEPQELLWEMSVGNVRAQLKQMREQWSPPRERLDAEVAAMRGSYLGELKHRARVMPMFHFFMVAFYSWRALSMMLLGMALFKWGVLSAARSTGLYLAMVVGGFAVGVPLIWLGFQRNMTVEFDFIAAQFNNSHYNYFGSVFVALGWVGIIMLICRSGVLHWLAASLGAVGRMAFTNYLMHTIICTTIFNGRSGLGLGKFNQLERTELLMIVAAIFLFQMIASPIWLRFFRFGPFEWLWRSLTYWKLQPMRK